MLLHNFLFGHKSQILAVYCATVMNPHDKGNGRFARVDSPVIL